MGEYTFEKLELADLDEILAIEEAAYSHPWSRGNFSDSFSNGDTAWGLRNAASELVGYFLVMPVVDELHLLNFAIRVENQRQGLGRIMLRYLLDYARAQHMDSVLLEVRQSNVRAIQIYLADGFQEIGRRRGYYPAANQTREDAIVMRRVCG
ncbi:ribosomal protein S18-alanine N-acetyltransferase [Undibacterium griseum]|uniref:[Ribosomal protein bS18]-alanine N-acetyltransferase n=1 Tax=Undibacterium griseum TaxID=2762295 RepID=A0ABR6YRC3_9BURK|nr:ribosomal protein S18-alanine N-acetyltransferase [Undibacterium griseum]MBC3886303.1 ribosomal protein S18-alanine N-acetyltransferase [Undibacterium griseum]